MLLIQLPTMRDRTGFGKAAWKKFSENKGRYFVEAWTLGLFMVSAVSFTILTEYPQLPLRARLPYALSRRMIQGLAMGITALLLIQSDLGKKSGPHMNPSVTLTYLLLGKIDLFNGAFYIIFQFLGAWLGVMLMKTFFPEMVSHPAVEFAVTVPGPAGVAPAFWMELVISFLLMLVLLLAEAMDKAHYSGYCAATMLFIYISFESPYSGMSINPARSFASAMPAHHFSNVWIYFSAPPAGMLLAGMIFKCFAGQKRRPGEISHGRPEV